MGSETEYFIPERETPVARIPYKTYRKRMVSKPLKFSRNCGFPAARIPYKSCQKRMDSETNYLSPKRETTVAKIPYTTSWKSTVSRPLKVPPELWNSGG